MIRIAPFSPSDHWIAEPVSNRPRLEFLLPIEIIWGPSEPLDSGKGSVSHLARLQPLKSHSLLIRHCFNNPQHQLPSFEFAVSTDWGSCFRRRWSRRCRLIRLS